MNFQFEKKLSLDGVTIAVCAATILIWLGGFKRQVESIQSASDAHTVQLEAVRDSITSVKSDVASVKGDVAVLSAVVVERTGKPLK